MTVGSIGPRPRRTVARRAGACYDSAVRRPLALLALLWPSLADAAEGEKVLSLVPAYGAWSVTQGEGMSHESIEVQGGQLGVDFERGLSDTLWLRGSAFGGAYDAPEGLAWAAGVTVGITYAIDVLRYVPYANLGAGAMVIGGDGVDTAVKPVIELGIGVDVLESRTFSWGLVARFDAFASSATFFSIGPRVSWRWGFF